MSSSAAYEVATVRLLSALGGFELPSVELAKLAREAENGFVGVACGIMDQMASTFGEQGKALLLDCRSLVHETVEIPTGLKIVVVNSGVRHTLGSSEYNKRRAECEEGVRILASLRPGVRSLRDVGPDDEARFFTALPPLVRKRCRHVVSENARVLEAVTAMRSGDIARLKILMAASHASLRDDYEVSCPELDMLVELALAVAHLPRRPPHRRRLRRQYRQPGGDRRRRFRLRIHRRGLSEPAPAARRRSTSSSPAPAPGSYRHRLIAGRGRGAINASVAERADSLGHR